MDGSNAALLSDLQALLGREAVWSDPETKRARAPDMSRMPAGCLALVRPVREEQVVALLEFALARGVAVVPRGAGTSGTGSALADDSQILLDLTGLDRIVDLSVEDQLAVVQPGVLTGDLQSAAEGRGLFYPPDPASAATSTLGGNVATCAGGLRAFKYGVTRDYVLGLRAALMGGGILETGGRFLKNAAGYDLTRLLVGSEGTLAVFLEITLRLIPRPPSFATALAAFDGEEDAFAAADAVLKAGVFPRALEFMDARVSALAGGADGAGEGPRLLAEVDGSPRQVADELATLEGAMRRAGARQVRTATTREESDGLWAGRRSISEAVYRVSPAKVSQDLGVARSQLASTVAAIRRAGDRHGTRVFAYGHAGDGNLHFNFLYDPSRPESVAAKDRTIADAVDIIIGARGTVTGEHGIGLKKRLLLERSLGRINLELMTGMKRLFDPHNLLNPGKVLPDGAAFRGAHR